MSQFFVNAGGGGGGGITSVVGQASLIAPTTTVTTVGTVATVENRAWETQYVVSPSTTQGLRGTFSTIQAAIDAAVVDGAALGNYKKIYIRTGSYTEDLSLPAGIMLVGQTFPAIGTSPIAPYQPTVVLGNHTFTGNAVLSMENLNFIGASGSDVFSNDDVSLVVLNCRNCFFSESVSFIFNITTASSSLRFLDCTFSSAGQDLFNVGGNTLWMEGCSFPQAGGILGTATNITMYNTNNLARITASSATLDLVGCSFITDADDYNIAGANLGSIRDCYFFGANVAGIQSTNTCAIIGCSSGGTGSLNDIVLTQTGTVYAQPMANQGNIMQGVTATITVDGPFTAKNNMYFIGVNNSVIGGQVLFNDPSETGPINEGQLFVVKDVVGNAVVYSIEITSDDGILFDGQPSIFLNSSYASVTLRFNGTNFNII